MPVNEESIMAFLKLFAIWRAVTAGSISKAEVSMMPTTFMVRTTVIPVRRTRRELIFLTLIPDMLANSSSKVVEKYSL